MFSTPKILKAWRFGQGKTFMFLLDSITKMLDRDLGGSANTIEIGNAVQEVLRKELTV